QHATGACTVWHICFFFSSRRRHTRSKRDWSSDVCSSDLISDITRPVKKNLSEYRVIEKNIQDKIYRKFLGEDLNENEIKFIGDRSEERRVGKECRSGEWQEH